MNLLLFLSDRCNVACDYCFLSLNKGKAAVLSEQDGRRAVEERKLSIALETERLAKLKALGLKVVELPAAERAKLMGIADGVIKKYPAVLNDVEEIRSVKEERLTTKL